MIKLEHICKSYKTGDKEIKAVDDISLTFRENEFVSILGPSGCGKTTLLNIIGALDKKDSGELYVNGSSTSSFTNRDWDSYRNNEIGFVFQNYYLIPQLNIFDNIGLTLKLSNKKEDYKDRILNVMKEVGLEGLEKKYPKQLSGGQCQRVAIARALINEPTVILADEPTGALDSKTASSIMDLLKDISKEHLVVMVTHNKEHAEQYSSRIIELLDGHIVNDSNPYDEEVEGKIYEAKHVHMSYGTGIKLSFKNMWAKKFRNIMTVIASSVGIVSTGLILSLRGGVNDYIVDVQKSALGDYPVVVTSYLKTSSEAKQDEYDKFPKDDKVIVEFNDALYSNLNTMDDDFLHYMDKLDESLFTAKKTNHVINFRLTTERAPDSYDFINQQYFTQICDNLKFVETQYDILKGHLPTNAHEFALVIDEYNRLSYYVMHGLGFDISTQEEFSFDDVLNKEYRLISAHDCYKWDEVNNLYMYDNTITSKQYYNMSTESFKISGIVRLKENAFSKSLLYNGMLYTKDFIDIVLQDSLTSEITQKQMEMKYDLNVFTGKPIEETVDINGATYTKDYYYERNLRNLGAKPIVSNIYYYTDNFEDRAAIQKYINNYDAPDYPPTIIKVKDYIEAVTSEFSGLVEMFTNVLLIISFISLFVAAIMIAIISYISILERRKEIGLLRALGARKKDILVMFVTENCFMGLMAGILGIIGAWIITKPVSNILVDLANKYASGGVLGTTTLEQIPFNWAIAPILLALAVVINVISGIIPAASGASKPAINSLRSE